MTDITHEALEALSKKATQGVWEVQDGCSWRRIGTRNGDGNVLCPTTSRTDGHPDLISGPGEDRQANLDFIVTLVNLYRTGQLILAQPSGDEVDAVQDAIKAAVMARDAEPGFWYEHAATAAITTLDAVRGKQ